MTDKPERHYRDRELAQAEEMARALLEIRRREAADILRRHSELIATLRRNKPGQ